ncbi:hypothetical protein TNIN_6191 [Trichonephila inaurata madagascariensis]|uniref:Single domain-containing protein n=1 Tax=Trichonephila inaurata madagascariensis TaxID=2747483 RepID=A0A8X6Y804_9ARAC|nr:hypothetical protein TNIN_6191 [Trichonephila inaurata madagascariensis]
MSKYFVVAICFVFAVFHCQAYQYFIPVLDGKDDCASMPVGSVWYDDSKCEKYACVLSGKEVLIVAHGCSKIDHPENCQLVKGKGSYPKCCHQIECTDVDKK